MIMGSKKNIPISVIYFLLALVLYLATRHLGVVVIMVGGAALLRLFWKIFKSRFALYSQSHETVELELPQRWSRVSLIVMFILTLFMGIAMVRLSFRGIENKRMISAFHEDEGIMADIYEEYIAQKRFDLGKNWGYTYGSLPIMIVSLMGRSLKPIIILDGVSCVVFNRLLLSVVLLLTGWLVFFIGKRVFKSPLLGLIAAGLLLSNAKVIEISILSNFPDIFHMFLFALAGYFTAGLLHRFDHKNAFLALLAMGIGFSVKYMGLPFIAILIIVFRYKQ